MAFRVREAADEDEQGDDEDGLVAQISVSGRSGPGRTSKGVGLGSDFKTVLMRYGSPEEYVITSMAAAGVQNAPYSSVVQSNGQVIRPIRQLS